MDKVECVVIGAGVVGLACGAALARSGREVMVLEAASQPGTQTSSRNSEVIHAGIYYTPRSLKAELCRRGKEQLYAYARDRGIAHRKTGKMIVATSEAQVSQLKRIAENGIANSVGDLEVLDATKAQSLEPAIRCHAALLSPSTGIIDSHALMLALQGDFEADGGMTICNTFATCCTIARDGFVIETGGDNATRVRARYLVNSAGLSAQAFAQNCRGLDKANIPPRYYAIGHYYRLQRRSPCNRLIYPVPADGGLGIHLTLDLGGGARFGPDVRWLDDVDYSFDDSLKAEFVAAIRTYLPDVGMDDLAPDYTGIRPKIVGPGQPVSDFRIDGPDVHGINNLVNLFGIESPGLTASLAIADFVTGLLVRR